MRKGIGNYFFVMVTIILLIGISANLYYYFTSCDYIVKRFVKREIKKAQSDNTYIKIYISLGLKKINERRMNELTTITMSYSEFEKIQLHMEKTNKY